MVRYCGYGLGAKSRYYELAICGVLGTTGKGILGVTCRANSNLRKLKKPATWHFMQETTARRAHSLRRGVEVVVPLVACALTESRG
jgi:hypothetical protein